MSTLVYRLSLKNFLSHWWVLSIYVVFLIGVPLYFWQRLGAESVAFAVVGASIWFLLSFVPLVVLHLRYVVESTGVVLIYDTVTRKLIYRRGNDSCEFFVSEIAAIESTKTPSLRKGSLLWYPWDSSCFAVIQLRSGKKLLITSLVVPRLRWPFSFPNETVHEAIFCWPKQ